jgi:protein translocase subunit yidC
LREGEDSLSIDLKFNNADANIIKRYTFNRGTHLIDLEYLVTNKSDANWKANLFGQIKRDSYEPPSDSGIGVKPFLGGAITTPEKITTRSASMI